MNENEQSWLEYRSKGGRHPSRRLTLSQFIRRRRRKRRRTQSIPVAAVCMSTSTGILLIWIFLIFLIFLLRFRCVCYPMGHPSTCGSLWENFLLLFPRNSLWGKFAFAKRWRHQPVINHFSRLSVRFFLVGGNVERELCWIWHFQSHNHLIELNWIELNFN